MADDMIDGFTGVGVCFALKREAAPFLHLCRSRTRVADAPFPAWLIDYERPGANDLLVFITGVGRKRTLAALDWLFERARPRRLIGAGFAGGLHESLKIGDVVIPATIMDGSTLWFASAGAPGCRLVGSDHIIAEPEQKRLLGWTTQSVAVDMESAAFAGRCAAAGVPFSVVRAISDTVDARLSPRLEQLLSGGEVSPWRVAWNCLRSPSLIPECLRLARDTTFAGMKLAVGLRSHLVLVASIR